MQEKWQPVFALGDAYTNLSKEITRLGLLLLGAIGFFHENGLAASMPAWCEATGLGLSAGAICCSLMHRWFQVNGLWHWTESQQAESQQADAPDERRLSTSRCRWKVGAVFFLLGVICMAAASAFIATGFALAVLE